MIHMRKDGKYILRYTAGITWHTKQEVCSINDEGEKQYRDQVFNSIEEAGVYAREYVSHLHFKRIGKCVKKFELCKDGDNIVEKNHEAYSI